MSKKNCCCGAGFICPTHGEQKPIKWFCNRCKTFVLNEKCECTKSPSPWIEIDTPQKEIDALKQMINDPHFVRLKKGTYETLISDLVMTKDELITWKDHIRCLAQYKHVLPPFFVEILEKYELSL